MPSATHACWRVKHQLSLSLSQSCVRTSICLLVFPAGILQPPFYHRFFPRSLNFGGIGVVIGHEITHGFDDKGRLFDKDGNLHRWWRDEAIYSFHMRAQCLIGAEKYYIKPLIFSCAIYVLINPSALPISNRSSFPQINTRITP